MKKIIMALVITAMAYTGAEAQTKVKPQEKCSLSADQKYVTCCKTSLNPAYNMNGKTALAKPRHKKAVAVSHRPLKKTYYVNNYQVCKDEGGYYTCCLYENTATTTLPDGE